MSRPPDPELAASTNRWMVAGVVLIGAASPSVWSWTVRTPTRSGVDGAEDVGDAAIDLERVPQRQLGDDLVPVAPPDAFA